MCRSTRCISSGSNLSPQAVFNGFFFGGSRGLPEKGGEGECALEKQTARAFGVLSGFRCFLGNNGGEK